MQEKKQCQAFFFLFFPPTSISSPISFSEITPNTTHLNAHGMMDTQAVLVGGRQTGNPSSLVQIKLHCLEFSLSARNEQFIPISSPHWGSSSAPCPAALMGKATGMWKGLAFTLSSQSKAKAAHRLWRQRDPNKLLESPEHTVFWGQSGAIYFYPLSFLQLALEQWGLYTQCRMWAHTVHLRWDETQICFS